MDTTQHDKDELAGDVLLGGDVIYAYLVSLGMHEDIDVYYERRSGRLPIGKYGANLIASKRKLTRHIERLTRGPVRQPRAVDLPEHPTD